MPLTLVGYKGHQRVAQAARACANSAELSRPCAWYHQNTTASLACIWSLQQAPTQPEQAHLGSQRLCSVSAKHLPPTPRWRLGRPVIFSAHHFVAGTHCQIFFLLAACGGSVAAAQFSGSQARRQVKYQSAMHVVLTPACTAMARHTIAMQLASHASFGATKRRKERNYICSICLWPRQRLLILQEFPPPLLHLAPAYNCGLDGETLQVKPAALHSHAGIEMQLI